MPNFKGELKIFDIVIVFVWTQYDGANIEQRAIGFGWRQNQEAKLKIVGGDLSGSNQHYTQMHEA